MNALITGGTGFIGSHLAEFLLEKGLTIFALVRDRHNLKWLRGLDIHLLEGDLLSIPRLPSSLDYVFHLAGLTKASNLVDYYTVNQRGTASFFQALRSQNIHPKKIIFLSSLAACGPSVNGKAVGESDPPCPLTPYGESKLLGEAEALKFKDDFSVIILRAAAIFGPRDRDFLPYFKLIKKGIGVSLGSRQKFLSLCYVRDLINALYLCTQKELESGEIFNIADPHSYSWDDFERAAGMAAGKKLKKVSIPVAIFYFASLLSEVWGKISRTPALLNRHKFRELKQSRWVADTRKAEEKLSFYPLFSLEKAVGETLDWYREYGWL
jgi:nucleoside-diphosphate-sugar epimerase